MKLNKILLLILVIGLVFAIACGNKNNATGYAGYNPQQSAAVGGGCGVSSQIPYEETPVDQVTNIQDLAA
tara:strand:- start:2126 stop:2335 length:210 start_codon:yes stop_codon:yes gene_type:complete